MDRLLLLCRRGSQRQPDVLENKIMYTNYCHNTLTSVFGNDYINVIKSESPINQMLKDNIDRAFLEATDKNSFKKLVKQYTKLTPSGIKECKYCQQLLAKF